VQRCIKLPGSRETGQVRTKTHLSGNPVYQDFGSPLAVRLKQHHRGVKYYGRYRCIGPGTMPKFLCAKEWVCRFRLSRLLPLLNLVCWLVFSVIFVIQSFPYRPHEKAFEEISYSYIFFGRALHEIDSGTDMALPTLMKKENLAV
jgi:hypothetical protein